LWATATTTGAAITPGRALSIVLSARTCYELMDIPVKSGHGGSESEAVPDGCDG
jgi:hypothetical protein